MSLQKSSSQQHLQTPSRHVPLACLAVTRGLLPTSRNGKNLGLNTAPGPYQLWELGSGLASPSLYKNWEQ